MGFKLTSRFGSKYKKNYTYKAEKVFSTKKEAQIEKRLMQQKTKDPHVKQSFKITKTRDTKKSSGWHF